jgi:hypothetical protein
MIKPGQNAVAHEHDGVRVATTHEHWRQRVVEVAACEPEGAEQPVEQFAGPSGSHRWE